MRHIIIPVAISIFTSAAQAQTSEPTIQLKEIVVNDLGGKEGTPKVLESDGYVPTSGRSATKTNRPLHEIARSVSAVTSRQLEDRKPQSLLEALSYTPSANVSQFGFDPRFDAFKVRGIDLSYTGIFKDGLRQYSSPNGAQRLEPYGLDSISILKGPAAAIYGASSSGGIVDLITKRPTEDRLREITVETGSFKRLQGAFDFSGPIDADHNLLYRLTGVFRKANTELGEAVKDNRIYIAPAFTWQPDDDTTFTLLSSYMDSTSGGTAAYLNRYDPVTGKSTGATHEFGGDGRFNTFRQKQGNIGYELDQRLSENVVLHQRLRYSFLSNKQEYVFDDYPGYGEERNNGVSTDTYLETDLTTGPLDHKILTGVDFGRYGFSNYTGTGTEPFTIDHSYKPEFTSHDKQRQTQTGIYLQDQIVLDAWRLTAGVRHDWLDSKLTTGDFADGLQDFSRKDSKTTGQASLGYVMDIGLMPYISYGNSFVANAGVLKKDVNNIRKQAIPTTGTQWEAGLKYNIPGQNAYVNAAVFTIRQDNGMVYETSAGTNEQVQLDLRSKGFEIEAGATLDNGLSLIAGYSYNDMKILRLSDATNGNTLNASPYHTASIWADYAVDSGALAGFGLSAGIRYVGASFGDNVHTNTLDNKPRTFVDAALRYDLVNLNPKLDGVRLQVNATNLLNEVKQTCTSGFCYWDEGRKVIGSVRYRF